MSISKLERLQIIINNIRKKYHKFYESKTSKLRIYRKHKRFLEKGLWNVATLEQRRMMYANSENCLPELWRRLPWNNIIISVSTVYKIKLKLIFIAVK